MNERDFTETVALLPLAVGDVPSSLTSLLEQDGIPFRKDAVAPSSCRFVLFDSLRARRPQLGDDQIGVDINEVRLRLGYDPFQWLDETHTCRSVWRVGPWEAKEEIAAVDRGAVRTAVLSDLRRTLEQHGGVWMRIGAMPSGYRTAFCFRFDHDSFIADDFHAVMDAIVGHESATTHFVCAATHQSHSDSLRRLHGCDVGSHGFHHHTYRSAAENIANIRRGIDVLESLTFEPHGFAAPHGRYHAELAEAVVDCGVSHTSEFAAAYDDVPFFTSRGDVVQIPIHPVCLGIVLEAVERIAPQDITSKHRAADDVGRYFRETASLKRASRSPIFLYGHPDGRLGRYPHILRDLLSEVSGWGDVWMTNFTAFQRWWRERRAIAAEVIQRGSDYEIRVHRTSLNRDAALEWIADDGVAAVPLDRPTLRVRREALNFQRPTTVEPPRPLRREPIGGFKERVRRALDWEYATPIAEIDTRLWQGKVKRALRRWKESVR